MGWYLRTEAATVRICHSIEDLPKAVRIVEGDRPYAAPIASREWFRGAKLLTPRATRATANTRNAGK